MNAYMGGALRSPVGFVAERHETFIAIRRDLHAHPELGLEEHRTAALVAERLHQWGIEVHTGIGGTGVVGVAVGDSIGKHNFRFVLPYFMNNSQLMLFIIPEKPIGKT
jgi:hypothetical protein